MNVTINPPKTPVTKGSTGIAAATIPNICKMPGPPAPFVPTPLPNIGKSGDSPKGYSTSVTIEGQPVAIQGASFGSMGDIASKGTGGGIVSSNAEGPTKFVGPGCMNVTIEGKNVHLLGDPMLNNCGPSGSPPNSATLQGVTQAPGGTNPFDIKCKDAPASNPTKLTECEKKEICAKCEDLNRMAEAGQLNRPEPLSYKAARAQGNGATGVYRATAGAALQSGAQTPDDFQQNFTHDCRFEEWKEGGADPDFANLDPDHIQEIQLGGHPTAPANLRWMSAKPNRWIGGVLKNYKTSGENPHTGVKPDCCD